MAQDRHYQPRWGRAFGALLAVALLIALNRSAWEAALGIAAVAVLVGGYLVRRRARRRTVYHHRDG